MSLFHGIFIKNGNVIPWWIIQLWSMFSPVRAHVDLNTWCFVRVLVWEASKHDPNPDHCSKILREIVKFERNAVYRQHQRYKAV